MIIYCLQIFKMRTSLPQAEMNFIWQHTKRELELALKNKKLEHEREMKRLELGLGNKQNSRLSSTTACPGGLDLAKNIHLVRKFNESNAESFFVAFERLLKE